MDHTSFHPNERLWSANRLPVILGQLEPHNNWLNPPMSPIPDLLDDNGQPLQDVRGETVRDFWFLPRHLASWKFLEEWRAEAYFRLDRRLTYKDLWARMVPGTDFGLHNSFNNRRARNVRGPLNMLSWEPRQTSSRVMVEVLENLTPQHLSHNTSWDVLPQGIAQPRNGTRYPGLLSTGLLPLNYFIQGRQNVHFPSPRVVESLAELARLQDLANDQGLQHWSELDPSYQNPSWWTRRRPSGAGAAAALTAAAPAAASASAPGSSAPLPPPPLLPSPTVPAAPHTQTPQNPSGGVANVSAGSQGFQQLGHGSSTQSISQTGLSSFSAPPPHQVAGFANPPPGGHTTLQSQPGPSGENDGQANNQHTDAMETASETEDNKVPHTSFIGSPDVAMVFSLENVDPMLLGDPDERRYWAQSSVHDFDTWLNGDTSQDGVFLSWMEQQGVAEYLVYKSAGGNLSWMLWYRWIARDQRRLGLSAVTN